MKEISFIRNNIEKWQKTEQLLEDVSIASPDELADAYVDLTTDLSFAQTHYPNSRITIYLNNLSSSLHNSLYKNKKERWSRLVSFWTHEVPLTMYDNRKLLLVSFIIFCISAIIGIFSQLMDPEFCRVILGDAYVDTTLDNIAKGKPMDIYNMGDESEMFFEISSNNIFVSFRMFVFGILTSIMVGFQIFMNSIMLGCFETFFYQHGLLGQSLLAVFQHGTLEISALIISGASGLAMGNGWLFPDTYSRIVSFQRGAKRGLKIIVGTIPIFICAGFIEGFITRHTETPDIIRIAVIVLSLVFVIYYFIILPYQRHQQLIDNNYEG